MRQTASPAILKDSVHDVSLNIKTAGKTSQFDWLDLPSPEQRMTALLELTAV